MGQGRDLRNQGSPTPCLLSLIEASDHGPVASRLYRGVGATGLEPVTPSL